MKRKFIIILSSIFATSAIALIIVLIVQTTRSSKISDNLFNVSISNAMDDVIDQLNRLKVEDYIGQNDRYKLLKYKRIEDVNNRLTELIEENKMLFYDSTKVECGTLLQDSIFEKANADLSTAESEVVTKYNSLLSSRYKLTDGSKFYEQFIKEISQYLADNLMSTTTFNYKMLDSLIAEKMIDNGVDMRPAVGILHTTQDEIIYCSEGNTPESLRDTPYRYSFCPDGLTAPNEYYILLKFPSSAIFLQKNSNIYLLISIFLIIVIVVLFLLSIRTIHNQRRLDEMKTDFIRNMTHEIKTPLATIALACDMLQDPIFRGSKDSQQYLGIIHDENQRMRVLVETILQSAKMSNKKYTIKPTETDVHQLIKNVIGNFEIVVKNRQGIIETHLDASQSVLTVDTMHFTNMIYNLIDNAIKYSTNKIHIILSTKLQDEQFIFTISDEGIGISPEDQKHIFEKFYRVSTGDVHNVKGFGIGLSYVAQVVSLHDGKIDVHSALNKGTTFTITLPLI